MRSAISMRAAEVALRSLRDPIAGTTMAAAIPRMTTTTRISMRVNPPTARPARRDCRTWDIRTSLIVGSVADRRTSRIDGRNEPAPPTPAIAHRAAAQPPGPRPAAFGGLLLVLVAQIRDLDLQPAAFQQADHAVELLVGGLHLLDQGELALGRVGDVGAGIAHEGGLGGPLPGESDDLEDKDGGQQSVRVHVQLRQLYSVSPSPISHYISAGHPSLVTAKSLSAVPGPPPRSGGVRLSRLRRLQAA